MWRKGTDVVKMLRFVSTETNERKLRLFAVACCRWLDHMMTEDDRKAVEAADRFADGLITSKERDAARYVRSQVRSNPLPAPSRAAGSATFAGGRSAAVMTCWHATEAGLDMTTQCQLIWCVFGNPFHPITVGATWLTSTVVALATGIYDERAFDRMPILADALQDAGCDNADILNHCRGPGPHVRGCWVVDLLLGKS
jgi:hypothetical protein